MSWESQISLGKVISGIPQRTGSYYGNPLITALTTQVMVADVFDAHPFLVPETHTFTSINIETTAAAAGKFVRLGIYNDNDGIPDSLVLDAGAISVALPIGAKFIVINQVLFAGWYWLAIVGDGTPTLRAGSNTSSPLPWLGFTSGIDVTYHIGWTVAQAYGALPDPFTPGGTLMATRVIRIMLGL